jgi:hypothetical protein
MKAGGIVIALVLTVTLVAWLEGKGRTPEEAFEDLSRRAFTVNTDFELEDVEPLPDGLSDRIGTIYASFEGPDDFDDLQITVYDDEPAAERRWEQLEKAAEPIRTELSVRQPRYAQQLCTLRNETIKCSVQLYEAVITGAAGMQSAEDLDEEAVKANAQVLLMTGVKNWLDARGLQLPEEQMM